MDVSYPRVIAVLPDSPASRAGVAVGDLLTAVNGEAPRDIIRYQILVDAGDPVLDVDRGGLGLTLEIEKVDGEPLGIEVESALFDQVRTCDNHCGFCFIYQLPPGMRKSLSVKDDDFRLSFLYGNFTTLTRFTEADLERVITEGLSPLYVSIHSTDPELRAELLRNRRGATSLRWLRALLDHGIEIHGQVVVCPGLNDGDALDLTLAGVLDAYPELESLAIVPLGVSAHSSEPSMRPHTTAEAERVVDIVESWQETYLELLGRRLVFAADEYYLLAQRPFPPADTYGGFALHEDGIGMVRSFELEFSGATDVPIGPRSGFFASIDAAPAEGYRSPRLAGSTEPVADDVGSTSSSEGATPVTLRPRPNAPVGILTGPYGAAVLRPLVEATNRTDVRVIEVANDFFGGNIGVTGLMVGADVANALAFEPAGHRYLLPDVCLTRGVFLDGVAPQDLPKPVEIVATDGISLRRALGVRSTLETS